MSILMALPPLQVIILSICDKSWKYSCDQIFSASTSLKNRDISFTAANTSKGVDVVGFLVHLVRSESCLAQCLQDDNGSELIPKELDRWTYVHKIMLDFSRPGKPTDNPYIESLNGKLRDEYLSVNWFMNMEDERKKIEALRREYNEERP